MSDEAGYHRLNLEPCLHSNDFIRLLVTKKMLMCRITWCVVNRIFSILEKCILANRYLYCEITIIESKYMPQKFGINKTYNFYCTYIV